ncbi:MAG: hypothetical protein HKM93_11205 [Desulfobacteraceae bacterium]|nr:hypothetical protein [Desulfobacteraceae bacterium]
MYLKPMALRKMENQTSSFFLPYSISLILHAVIITFLIVKPEFAPRKQSSQSVISVSMVSLPTSTPASVKPTTSASKEIAPPKEEAAAPKPKPVAAAPAPPEQTQAPVPRIKKIKRSLKKETFKSNKVVSSALKNLKEKVETSKPDPKTSVFEKLRRKVQEQESDRMKMAVEQTDANATQSTGEGDGKGLSGQQRAELVDLYRLEIAYQIQKNWAFSDQMAGLGSSLRASVIIKVMPNGEIRDIAFIDRSGNTVLDDSVYKALIKSSPVDAHPKGVVAPYVEMGLNFTPEGVR